MLDGGAANRSNEQRRGYERTAQRWGKLVPGARVEPVTIGTLGAERVVPPQAKPDRALLWFFGGGYRSGSPATERSLASRIADPIQAFALLPAYRLCPEHPLDASLEDAVTAYRWLRDEVGSADRVIVGGVSAGGGLALRLLCALRDQGEELPAAAAVISPATDLAGTGASLRTNAKTEAIFPPAAIAGMRQGLVGVGDLHDARFSPLFADLAGLPPLLIHVAGAEANRDDGVRFADRAREAGVEVTLRVFPGLWHCFHEMAGVPEARAAVEEIVAFALNHLPLVPENDAR